MLATSSWGWVNLEPWKIWVNHSTDGCLSCGYLPSPKVKMGNMETWEGMTIYRGFLKGSHRGYPGYHHHPFIFMGCSMKNRPTSQQLGYPPMAMESPTRWWATATATPVDLVVPTPRDQCVVSSGNVRAQAVPGFKPINPNNGTQLHIQPLNINIMSF